MKPRLIDIALDAEKAASVARLLILTDMMGRPTHGLAQCEAYLDEIEHGQMTCDGEPEVVRDGGDTVAWDGGYRPGLWLVDRAITLGIERARVHGVFTCAIRRSHHIGCLFEYPWLMDSEGRPTHDPKVMEDTAERGSLLLLGGYEAGHKGFGLALMVEALTQGLGGFGRRDAPTRWGAARTRAS
jgi:LDH2 family malate/lactate/ureidoglycolate dehydrogenase